MASVSSDWQSRDRTIRLWSRASTSCTATLTGCDEVPLCLSLRGGLLLSGENTHRKVAKARLWSIGCGSGGDEDGKSSAQAAETDTTSGDGGTPSSPRVLFVYAEHTEPIWSVSLGADYALSASHDTSARVWPILASEGGHTQAKTPSFSVLEHPEPVESVSVEGALVATGCGDGKVRIWSLVSFTTLRTLEHEKPEPVEGAESSVAPVANGKPRAASSVFCVRLLGGVCISRGLSDNQVKVWSLACAEEQQGECVAVLRHSLANVRCIAVSPSGFIASVGSNRSSRRLVVWKPHQLGSLRSITAGTACSIDLKPS